MIPDVISTIVENDLCIGCGVCAAICPESVLQMRFNHVGEYNPFEDKKCIKECGLCLKVCPFADGNDNEDKLGKALFGAVPGIFHNKETGYYLDCFAGYAPDMAKPWFIRRDGNLASFSTPEKRDRGLCCCCYPQQ